MKQFPLILIALCTLIGCRSPRAATRTIRDVSIDTVYLSNHQYDSIYVSRDRMLERTQDTLVIRDVSVEYRYKLLRDTIFKTRTDSIPYEVTITEVKEITGPLSFFDKLCRACFFVVLAILLRLLLKLKDNKH